ncbi:hypothetical protein J7373_10980 [Xanthomonas sp. A2111]|uniref:DUF1795 domain-containing protein n=1 Tax=Xanthomonas hawaiiensis TaxID=3003247 RepID=A0ABU2I1L6_9XANT|nr:hypothetical protein [Xanthomonas sp. A2111]MBO9828772.1 hypothetical protein [Xanthomonas sp. A2111]MDS9992036.1 hypothetical protein [Xanthomonas sp. A2111]
MTSNSKTAAHIFTCRSKEGKKNVAFVVVPADPKKAEFFNPGQASEKQILSRFYPVQGDLGEARNAIENIPPTATSFHSSLVAYFDVASGAKVIEFFWFDSSKKRHLLTYQIWKDGASVHLQQAQSLIAATGLAQAIGDEIIKEKSRLDASASALRKSSLRGLGGKKN